MKFYTTVEVDEYKSDIKKKEKRRKIARDIIDFASNYLNYSVDRPARIRWKLFEEAIPSVRQGNKFISWLKVNMFIEVDSTYVIKNELKGIKGKSKGYVIDKEFFWEIFQLSNYYKIKAEPELYRNMEIGLITIENEYLLKKYENELKAKVPFKQIIGGESGRQTHELVNKKRDRKEVIFNNFIDYDISTAAPTILFQQYEIIMREFDFPRNRFNELSYIEYYIKNKTYERERIAELLGYDKSNEDNFIAGTKIVKKIINGLFNGMRIGENGYSIIFTKYLEYNKINLRKLQRDKFIKSLKRDIRTLWRILWDDLNYKNFKSRLKTTGKKWMLYLKAESNIMNNIIEPELIKITGEKGKGYFLEYDGFRLHKKYHKEFNIKNIEDKIYEEVEIRISLDNNNFT